MEALKQIIHGIYQFMLDVQVPFFELSFPLWFIFLFGLIGGVAVWAIKKYFG